MTSPITLYGYSYSVYAWISRFALGEKGVDHTWIEVDPFADDVPANYLSLNPFCRVPTLQVGDFVLYETCAIIRFIDEAYSGPSLQPVGAQDRGRMVQIISVLDQDGYWPLVRQVFAHRVFHPSVGEPVDTREIAEGLDRATQVLAVLEGWLDEGAFLVGHGLSLADIHLAPMLSYFCEAPEGRALLRQYPRLERWWSSMREREALVSTRPDLASLRQV